MKDFHNALNYFPHEKIVVWSKLKLFENNKLKAAEMAEFVLIRVENAGSPFPTIFSRDFFFKVVKYWVCLVKR